MNDAERALAYSPSKALHDGDLTPYLNAYADDSAAIYAQRKDVQILSYGDKATNTIDLFHADVEGPAPLHVFIHGGYWQALSKRDSIFPATGFLQRGISYAALDYTLAPDATLDDIVNECVAALTDLFEHAETLRIDPKRITLSGSSAGAHLVAMTCLNLTHRYQPSAVVLLSGIYDLEPLIGTYVNDLVGMNQENACKNSPMFKDLSQFPKSIVAWGEIETDEFKRQSQSFAKLLPDAYILEIKGRNHFDIVYDLSNNSPLAQRVLKFAS